MTGSPTNDDEALPLRVIVDDKPTSGVWNMAVDAVLLESALAVGRCSLRWYRWSDPTLSLGHFQPLDDPAIDERFAGLPRVRRLSGGGAILHDHELTYSCAIGPGHRLSSSPNDLYTQIHKAIADVLSEFGISVHARGATDRSLDANFLCFSRGDANDLLANGHKVLGSAQRRRRGAILQHGSLLLKRSLLAPEFPGIFDQSVPPVSADRLQCRLVESTTGVLGCRVEIAGLTSKEMSRVQELVDDSSLLSGRPE